LQGLVACTGGATEFEAEHAYIAFAASAAHAGRFSTALFGPLADLLVIRGYFALCA
jgi:hypothetical protein